MSKHIVKCKICGQMFDRGLIQAVKCGARRYAHQACFPEGELVPLSEKAKDNPDLIKLKEYIGELFGDSTNWARTNQLIKKFKEENGYTYSGILKSLIYFYEVKGNSKEKANNTISIVPFVYQDAYTYYYNLFMTEEANKDKTLSTETKEITIKPPISKRPKYQFFNFEEWEEE